MSSEITPPSTPSSPAGGLERRQFLGILSAAGLGGGLFPGVLWAVAQETDEITIEVVEQAEKLAGLTFTEEQREMMLGGLRGNIEAYRSRREAIEIPNHVAPALHFDPVPPGRAWPRGESTVRPSIPTTLPARDRDTDLAFASLPELGALIRAGEVTSEQLTRLSLDRLRRHGPRLECVVTLTEERGMDQARRADRELADGRVRGPLHGIPWGAKDLLATRGYPTTWGAAPFSTQVLDMDATVVSKLDEAGAVLVAKLTLGALAMGDVWFDGRTRNPWNLEQGSSGSSAGSAAAVVAGLVGFAIGSETLGSIVSPATRCGATGLRPSFGRVSRHGAMALSWSMDKIGPLCRSVEDCALVLGAIQGEDLLDRTVRDVPFRWDGEQGIEGLRVGYFASAFEGDGDRAPIDRRVLEVLRGLGVELHPVGLPEDLPIGALRTILSAEAAAAFDELTRSGQDELLVRQDTGAWPNTFRTARFIPAVEYIQANRVRTILMGALDRAWADVDVVVTPSYASSLLLATNLTGHPAVVLPHISQAEADPLSISFVGGLWKDAEALRVAKAYQDASGHHLERPPGFA
ncbi:MAG: amidase [Gemmatimonadales bacterium]|nr:MAG: amidase [Gemmatimonadales bacterium]